METGNRDGRIDGRVMNNIRFQARRLARGRVVPGMAVEDYEQDLLLDLLHRRTAFEPERASFATFADRVVGHRISTLASPSRRLETERRMISVDMSLLDEDGESVTLRDLLPVEAPPLDDDVLIAIDVRRFVETLPDPLAIACGVLLADNVAEGVRAAGIHRSTAYDRLKQLREEAAIRGLDVYFAASPDSSPSLPVCGGHGVRRPAGGATERMSMTERIRPPRVCLLVGDEELRGWLANAKGGDTLEYHRGILAIDRLSHGSRLSEKDRRELERVARTLLSLAEAGRGHLLQRRHGNGDYSYLFVLRPISSRAINTPMALLEDVS